MNQNVSVVKTKKMGRGVVAKRKFKAGDIIEVCPVILFDMPEGKTNLLQDYSFRWNKKQVAISLGYGSLYNHSYDPNAYAVQDVRAKEMHVTAIKDIAVGEEIFINYNGEPDCQDELWFKPKQAPKGSRDRVSS